MKNIVVIICGLFAFTSCEDVIDVDLNTADPRLVIDASINWVKNTSGNEQQIKLSLTAPFFENGTPPANGATVQITNTSNDVFNFTEDGTTGIYKTTDFIPVINEAYTLTVIYNGETYSGSEILTPVAPIDYIEQNNTGGFSGEDIELKAFYTDPANIENYYLFEFIAPIGLVPTLEVYEDRFTDGNQIFGFYSEEDLEPGMDISIRNYGISERFYEFMFILLQQGGEQDGGPFETQPATVRGNCVNNTTPDQFPFGYFRLSEVDELIYTLE